MKKLSFFAVFFLSLLLVNLSFAQNRHGNNQNKGKGNHNNRNKRYANLEYVSKTGTVIIDSSKFNKLIYLLDENNDGNADILLNFGPFWALENFTLPEAGEQIEVEGYLGTRKQNLYFENINNILHVVKLNGQKVPYDAKKRKRHLKNKFSKDSLKTFEGAVVIDTNTFKNKEIYLLDINNDNIGDYILGLGLKRLPEDKTLPEEGSSIKVEGILLNKLLFKKPLIIVYKINDEIWRDIFAFNNYNNGNNNNYRNKKMNQHNIASRPYPNPFNPTVQISYSLTEPGYTTVEIYDIVGRKIKTLVNEYQSAGEHKVQWNGTNSYGAKVSAGTYFYLIRNNNSKESKKIIYLK